MIDKYLEIAQEAALEAAEVQRTSFDNNPGFKYKSDGDIVTETDRESESAIISKISEHFPQHEIISEEKNPDADLPSGSVWIVDPIDGTVNFQHGLSQFCTGIALLDKKGVKTSVIHNPISGDMYTAVRDNGAQLNGESIEVSQNTRWDQSLVAASWSNKEYTPEQIFGKLRKIHTSSHGIRKTGSAVLSTALTAAGAFDGCFSISLGKWDVAAGLLLVEEAGGKVTNLFGENDHREIIDDSIIATNGHVHDQLRESLRDLDD